MSSGMSSVEGQSYPEGSILKMPTVISQELEGNKEGMTRVRFHFYKLMSDFEEHNTTGEELGDDKIEATWQEALGGYKAEKGYATKTSAGWTGHH